MTSAVRVQRNWTVVEDDWRRFRENVAEKWGAAEGFVTQELEQAAREFLDEDPLAGFEERVRRVVSATGRALGDLREKKNPLTRSGTDESRVTMTKALHDGLWDELAEFADENELECWEVLTAVLREYNDGGRAQRLKDVLDEETADDVVTLAEEATGTYDGTGSLSKTERIERAIAQRLGDQFNEDDLARAIDAETSGTGYYHKQYPPRVIEFKGVKRWEILGEDTPDVFLPPETWDARMTGDIIRELGGRPDDDEAPPPFSRAEFADAAGRAGIEVSEENKEEVNRFKDRVLERTGYEWDDDAEEFAPIGAGEDGEETPCADDPPESDLPPHEGDETEPQDDVDDKMTALMNATPAAATAND